MLQSSLPVRVALCLMAALGCKRSTASSTTTDNTANADAAHVDEAPPPLSWTEIELHGQSPFASNPWGMLTLTLSSDGRLVRNKAGARTERVLTPPQMAVVQRATHDPVFLRGVRTRFECPGPTPEWGINLRVRSTGPEFTQTVTNCLSTIGHPLQILNAIMEPPQ